MFTPTPLLSLILLGLVPLTSGAPTTASSSDDCDLSPRAATYWQPKPNSTLRWDYSLAQGPTTGFKASDGSSSSTVDVWGLDLFDTSKETIAALQKQGKKVVCYFSAGSYEEWRSDASSFPKSTLGNNLSGWAGERWLDVRASSVRSIMTKRIALAASKGCNAVDPDNVDGYNNKPGFPLTQTDAVNYVTFLADQAHAKGLASGLKNGAEIVSRVVGKVDYAVNEQCVEYGECASWQPFIKAGKPVFHVEYPKGDDVNNNKAVSAATKKKVCQNAGAKGFNTIIKNMNLDGWIQFC